MSTTLRLLLLALQAYGIFFALIGAHRLRRRVGLDLFFVLIGGVVVYMWWVTRLDIDAISVGSLRLPVSSAAYFSAIFSGLLLVYVVDGLKLARRLIVSVVTLTGFLLFLEILTYSMLAVSPQLPYALPEPFTTLYWKETIWLSLSLLLDMLVVVIVYQTLLNRLPRLSQTARIFLSMAAALVADAIVVTTFSEYDNPAFWGTLLSRAATELVMAAALAPFLGWYSAREADARESVYRSLDIFRSVDELSRSLHFTKTKYDALIERTLDAVVLLDSKGFVREANRRFLELTGYGLADLRELHYTTLIASSDRPRVMSQVTVKMERDDTPSEVRFTGLTKQGQPRKWRVNLARLTDEADLKGMLAVFRDETENIATEIKMRDAANLAAVGDLRAKIVEGLVPPVERLLRIADSLGDPALPPDKRAAMQRERDVAREAIESLFDALDGLEPPDEAERASAPVRDLVEPALAILADRIRRDGIAVTSDYGAPSPRVDCVPSRLSQVFIHLLDNATHWARKSSAPAVEVRAGYKTLPDGRRRAEVRVRDNGPGIPEADRQRVYDPFFTSEPDHHSGLGLAFCRHVVLELGGELVHRRNDGWTEAIVSFPAEPLTPVVETVLE
ncbi:MAG: PAS domain-containing sensor histidine kinase [Myxococcales bacterium]|nr:MAG: PAS domain-containing sensor histidine kinase [Myxococcales bacterium]